MSGPVQALFDGVIAVGVPRDECWARRKARALAMAHLPPGFSNSESDEKNYEVVGSYVLSTADTAAVTAAAAEHAPEDGRLAWLRLYFDEVDTLPKTTQRSPSAVPRFNHHHLSRVPPGIACHCMPSCRRLALWDAAHTGAAGCWLLAHLLMLLLSFVGRLNTGAGDLARRSGAGGAHSAVRSQHVTSHRPRSR